MNFERHWLVYLNSTAPDWSKFVLFKQICLKQKSEQYSCSDYFDWNDHLGYVV